MLGFLFGTHAGTLAKFRTTIGDIDVELYDRDKPVTVRNFKRYVENGLYLDGIFHRATVPPEVQVIQGGYYRISNRESISNYTAVTIPTFAPITNEFSVGTFRSNTYGTLAMAKTSDPNSATAQFYFNLADNSAALDNTNNSGGFTVFGHMVRGTNVLNALNAAHPTASIQIVNLPGGPQELPLLATAQPPWVESDELVYVDITLLRVEICPAANATEISWHSVSNRTNVVEYTTVMPPKWKMLISTNGSGLRCTVSDTTSTDTCRFYRVRVHY